jgi:adenylylsulfate kinase
MRILIMGLPGSGKTTLAKALAPKLAARLFNADELRESFNDWDFSNEGRLRQADRMRMGCMYSSSWFNIADFVAALPEQRDIFDADYTVWVDTIKEGRFDDTNKAFVPPEKYDIRVTEQDAEKWAHIIANAVLDDARNKQKIDY